MFTTFYSYSQVEYSKIYFPNGTLKEEGWIIDAQKNKYWFFYSENGNKKAEGHFENDRKVNWWIFYDKYEKVVRKCEYKNNKLNGFVINYQEGAISSAEKYLQGKQIKYWNSMAELRKDNSELF
jgi:antitoxin component YwqK of YwqJK toxin-antitoxin module